MIRILDYVPFGEGYAFNDTAVLRLALTLGRASKLSTIAAPEIGEHVSAELIAEAVRLVQARAKIILALRSRGSEPQARLEPFTLGELLAILASSGAAEFGYTSDTLGDVQMGVAHRYALSRVALLFATAIHSRFLEIGAPALGAIA